MKEQILQRIADIQKDHGSGDAVYRICDVLELIARELPDKGNGSAPADIPVKFPPLIISIDEESWEECQFGDAKRALYEEREAQVKITGNWYALINTGHYKKADSVIGFTPPEAQGWRIKSDHRSLPDLRIEDSWAELDGFRIDKIGDILRISKSDWSACSSLYDQEEKLCPRWYHCELKISEVAICGALADRWKQRQPK